MQEYIKNILGSGNTTLIISNDGIHDIIKLTKALEDSSLLLKGVTKTVQNELKEQKEDFLVRFLDFLDFLATLGASLCGNLLIGKGALATSQGRGLYRAGKGKGVLRAGYRNKMDF